MSTSGERAEGEQRESRGRARTRCFGNSALGKPWAETISAARLGQSIARWRGLGDYGSSMPGWGVEGSSLTAGIQRGSDATPRCASSWTSTWPAAAASASRITSPGQNTSVGWPNHPREPTPMPGGSDICPLPRPLPLPLLRAAAAAATCLPLLESASRAQSWDGRGCGVVGLTRRPTAPCLCLAFLGTASLPDKAEYPQDKASPGGQKGLRSALGPVPK